ncbi:PmoA family protein [Telmatocola sphagniphila]|uniref:PmoA family protein n=1 Tax=Telmatocola sphagniphila TaxID=1123043 RepID=A0A8E6B3T6_9BACT|nr:DUF6807 family protein [Telmatocola sphagniphila]QVL30606.1 PmoA family protein [Telmatocola sphagniphila]
MFRLILVSLFCFTSARLSASESVRIVCDGPKKDLSNVLLQLPITAKDNSLFHVTDAKGMVYANQVRHGSLGLGTEKSVLVILVTNWKANENLKLSVTDVTNNPRSEIHSGKGFQWTTLDNYPLLKLDERPVLEYMNSKHDNSSKTGHYLTFKLYHHVFDPVDGKTVLTSGAYREDEKKLYAHHRGLFYGFNKISYDDKKQADVWHGSKNEFVSDQGILAQDAGYLLGSQRLAIDWHGQDGATFAKEQRELTAYNLPGGTLIDFVSLLKTDKPKVRLDGDPQHAGFHFRANMEVADNQKTVGKEKINLDTYYLRQDGKGKPGETRNWDPKTKKGPVNLDWNAMSFVVGNQRYTVLYMDHPKNPKEARYSERDYGRFGSYFEYDLTPQNPLLVRYRLWIQRGDMTLEQCQALSAAFHYDGKTQPE